jgi:hypothetical protein
VTTGRAVVAMFRVVVWEALPLSVMVGLVNVPELAVGSVLLLMEMVLVYAPTGVSVTTKLVL